MGSPAFPKLRGADAQSSREQDNVSTQLQPIAVALAKTPIMGAPPPGWIAPSLLNGFVNLGGAFAVAGLHRDALGYVHTKGMVTNAAGVGAGTTVFIFPSGYRPRETQRFPVEGTGATYQSIQVDGSGLAQVQVAVAAAGNLNVTLSFLAEQ